MTAARIAWGGWATMIAAVGTALLLLVLNDGRMFDHWSFGSAAALLFGSVGTVVVTRRPGNALGWVLWSVGLVDALGALGVQYGVLGLVTRPGAVPWAGPATVLAFGISAGPGFGLLITFVLLLFPTGGLPSRRWRAVAWGAAAGIALMVIGLTWHGLRVGGGALLGQITNPDGLRPDGVPGTLNNVGHLLVFTAFPLGVVSLFVRRRGADDIVRHQLRWFAYAAALLLVALASTATPLPDRLSALLEIAATAFLPLAVGVAITRYRLYDIDRIISRTVAYAAVTAALAAVYGLVAVLPSAMFNLRSDLLVAAATLAAAAAFGPLRRRVQTLVDRRFDRAAYDAQRTVEAFGTRLRSAVELDMLTADLLTTVAGALHPARASMWLRSSKVDHRPHPVPRARVPSEP